MRASLVRDRERLRYILSHEMLQRRILFDQAIYSQLQDTYNAIVADGTMSYGVYAMFGESTYGQRPACEEFWAQWVFPSIGLQGQHSFMKRLIKERALKGDEVAGKVQKAIQLVDETLKSEIESELLSIMPVIYTRIGNAPKGLLEIIDRTKTIRTDL